MENTALRELEPWTGPSIAAGILLALVVVVLLVYVIVRYLRN